MKMKTVLEFEGEQYEMKPMGNKSLLNELTADEIGDCKGCICKECTSDKCEMPCRANASCMAVVSKCHLFQK